jgi:hypothetical protein
MNVLRKENVVMSAVIHKPHSRLRSTPPPALWAGAVRGPAPGFGTVDFVDNHPVS